MRAEEARKGTDLSKRNLSVAVFFCALIAIASQAQDYRVLVNFYGAAGSQANSITQGFDGNLYGTTVLGGTGYAGNVFEIGLDGTFSKLYSFCTSPDCTAGFGPSALVQAPNGNFYGTNYEGAKGYGAIYTMTATGKVTTIHEFLDSDGAVPDSGLILAGDGNFYGTTFYGGPSEKGTIFKISPRGAFTQIYNFCSQANCADGGYPGGLVQARDGNLYGTTPGTGGIATATIFKMTSGGSFTTLYNTTTDTAPLSLLQGRDGNFYGFTVGVLNCSPATSQCGTVFKMTPSGEVTTLHTFCSQANCSDGYLPTMLIQATDGNFYGTTGAGSAGCPSSPNFGGTMFRMTPDGTVTTLHAFCGYPTDGDEPTYLIQDTDGSFFGTTFYGGAHANGTVFHLSTGLPAFVKLVQSYGRVGEVGGIVGQGLTGTTGVFFNGVSAAFSVVSDTYIKATVPPGATTGFVTVGTASGALTSNAVFQVIR